MLLVIGIVTTLNQTLQRDVQPFPELADHFQSKRTFVVKYLGDPPAVSNVRFQFLAL